MKMRKLQFITLAVVILTLALTAGCGRTSENTQNNGSSQENMITITDGIGRTVTVPKNPEYVATIFATSSQIVAMLGDSEKIVAISDGNLKDSLFVELYPAVLNARVPAINSGVNIEELYIDPVPQVIFCASNMTMDPRVMEKAELFGVPMVTVEYTNVEELKHMVETIGAIMGREEKAKAYNDYLDQTQEFVSERVKDIPEDEKREVYHAINELLRTTVSNTLPGDWMPKMGITLVGAQEIDGPNSDKKNQITLEELFVYDPPYIIINGEDVMEYVEITERLHSLSAYRNNQMYLLPSGVTRYAHPYSIETPLAMFWVAKTIYPELFEDVDLYKEIGEFYAEFFNAEISDETITEILSGKGLRTMKNRTANQ